MTDHLAIKKDPKKWQRLLDHINDLKNETYWDKKGKINKIKNPWAEKIDTKVALKFYLQAEKWGREIDGKHLYFQHKQGVISLGHDYDTLRIIAKKAYPKLEIDTRVVYEGDSFAYENNGGAYTYKYKHNNPFANQKQIVGAFCALKPQGSNTTIFIVINSDTIAKMREAASYYGVWDNWEDEMAIKSVLKRALKRLPILDDSLQLAIDSDNQGQAPEVVGLSKDVLQGLKDAQTKQDVHEIYQANSNLYEGQELETLQHLTKERIEEITDSEDHKEPISNTRLLNAIVQIKQGKFTKKKLLDMFNLTGEQLKTLTKALSNESV